MIKCKNKTFGIGVFSGNFFAKTRLYSMRYVQYLAVLVKRFIQNFTNVFRSHRNVFRKVFCENKYRYRRTYFHRQLSSKSTEMNNVEKKILKAS